MKAKYGVLVFLLLSACQPSGLVAENIVPANLDFYKDLPENFVLKGQVAVGEVTSQYEDSGWMSSPDDVRPEVYKLALSRTLQDAKVLAQGSPQYVLSARIMDKRYPSVGTMHVTAGTAVAYQLVEAASQREVYSKTITSTHEIQKGFFQDSQPLMYQATAQAFGENTAQLARELVFLAPLKSQSLTVKPYGVAK